MLQSNESEEVTPLHPMFCPLISQYQDIFLQDLPSGLPLVLGNKHQIFDAPLPNKATYRYNPQEIKELQRQVDELLARGYVRENMIPCLVSALLVSKKDGTFHMCLDSRATTTLLSSIGIPYPGLMTYLTNSMAPLSYPKLI